MKRIHLALILAVFAVPALAQVAGPMPASDTPAWLGHLLAWIPENPNASMITALTLCLELVLRFVKSAKPLSILYALAAIVSGLGVALVRLGGLMDRVLPQRTKGDTLLK